MYTRMNVVNVQMLAMLKVKCDYGKRIRSIFRNETVFS